MAHLHSNNIVADICNDLTKSHRLYDMSVSHTHVAIRRVCNNRKITAGLGLEPVHLSRCIPVSELLLKTSVVPHPLKEFRGKLLNCLSLRLFDGIFF